jgi:hypothetical protein
MGIEHSHFRNFRKEIHVGSAHLAAAVTAAGRLKLYCNFYVQASAPSDVSLFENNSELEFKVIECFKYFQQISGENKFCRSHIGIFLGEKKTSTLKRQIIHRSIDSSIHTNMITD